MVKRSHKLLLLALTICLGAWFLPAKSFSQPVSSGDLIGNARDYDGKIVSYQGELIGDIMNRGAFSWVNINDGKNAIGAWTRNGLLKDLVYTGSYRCQGDFVEVTGAFHRSCLEHGGDLDLHVDTLRKISSGRIKPERINVEKEKLVFMLLGVLCLVLILSQLKRPQVKK